MILRAIARAPRGSLAVRSTVSAFTSHRPLSGLYGRTGAMAAKSAPGLNMAMTAARCVRSSARSWPASMAPSVNAYRRRDPQAGRRRYPSADHGAVRNLGLLTLRDRLARHQPPSLAPLALIAPRRPPAIFNPAQAITGRTRRGRRRDTLGGAGWGHCDWVGSCSWIMTLLHPSTSKASTTLTQSHVSYGALVSPVGIWRISPPFMAGR